MRIPPRRTDSRLVLVLVGLTAAACETEQALVDVDVGALHVTTLTSGENIDEDGYSLLFDTGTSLAVQASGTLRVLSVPAGERTVELGGLAENCEVEGLNPRTVTVTTGDTTSVDFGVTCFGAAGTVAVTVATTGDSIDVDGYRVATGSDTLAVAVDDSVAFTDVRPGPADVELLGVATNCSVPGGAILTVDVPSGGQVLAAFSVICTAPATGPGARSRHLQGLALPIRHRRDPDGR